MRATAPHIQSRDDLVPWVPAHGSVTETAISQVQGHTEQQLVRILSLTVIVAQPTNTTIQVLLTPRTGIHRARNVGNSHGFQLHGKAAC
jgi:hypothetical protein